MNGYQLLNEVGSGGTLSSLFTILSLFTEDVQMSWQDEYPDVSSDDMSMFDEGISMGGNRRRRADSDVPNFNLGSPSASRKGTPRRGSVSSTASTVHGSGIRSPPTRASSEPPDLDEPTPIGIAPPPLRRAPPTRRPTQDHRGVVARATVDTTLAVIPAEAFRRLTKKFPKATGHIVQGIFSAFMLRMLNSQYHSHSHQIFSRHLQRCPQVSGFDQRSTTNGKGHQRHCLPPLAHIFL